MRPVRLDIEGFGTFRQPVTVDFSDTDYFALVGPTGSGKTTVIDAICFALYGSAPRWPRRNQISLAMAPSTSHTRVSLLFESGGRLFAAVRILARAAGGQVNTKQARLIELPPDIPVDGELGELLGHETASLAESADNVEAMVESLLGLSWEHFIQCVVLPQGEFASFLHSGKADRQGLLVKLLGLQMYDRVGKRATAIAKEDATRATTLSHQLTKYEDATAEAESAAQTHLNQVLAVEVDLTDVLNAWTTARDSEGKTATRLATLTSELDALAGVSAPDGLTELADQRAAAVKAAEEADTAVQDAEKAELEAEQAATDAGEPTHWSTICAQHERRAGADKIRAELHPRAAEAQEQVDAAFDRVTSSTKDVAAATEALEAVRRANSADHLALGLVVGDQCPVCLRQIEELTDRPPHAGISEAEAALRRTDRDRATANEAHVEATRQQDRIASEIERWTAEIDELTQTLADEPDQETSEERLTTAKGAQSALDAARKAGRKTRDQHRTLYKRVVTLAKQWDEAGQRLHEARDTVASLAPPPATGEHADDWTRLVDWAGGQTERLQRQLIAAQEQETTARNAVASAEADVATLLERAGATLPRSPTEANVTVAVGKAVEQSRQRLERIRERRGEAADLAVEIAAAEKSERLNRDLGQLLNANNFERWLLEEALAALVTDASVRLLELSGGQFELALDDRQDLLVIDHNDASMSRLVQTLSGGETFQASLALALALSSQIAGLSAAASGRLDTILLDEGFGTLDTATLDVVASTLEQLAGGGERTVGVVTHVSALAERVPVRFEVSRQGSTSTVAKVTA